MPSSFSKTQAARAAAAEISDTENAALDTTAAEPAAIKRPHVTVYSDGACKGNPGRGGWGPGCKPERTRKNSSAARQ